MHLPFPFKKKDHIEYFLALLLSEEKVSAVILKQIAGQSSIVGKHEEYIEQENQEIDEWIKLLDKIISQAEEKLPPQITAKKTIFGVPSSWVEENHIKKEYLTKLRKASDSLSLTPIGFIEIPEAIIHLLQEEEGAPVSAILAEIGRKQITVSIVRAGKIVQSKQAALTTSPPQSVDDMLKSFTNVDVLPSRIIVINSSADEQLIQSFVAHQWSRSLPFFHIPQITRLPDGFDARAIVFGASLQMGFDTHAILKSGSEIQTFPTEKKSNDQIQNTPSLTPPTLSESEINSEERFGFVIDKDIALLQKDTQKTAEENIWQKEEAEEDSLSQQESNVVKSKFKQKNFPLSLPQTLLDLTSYGKRGKRFFAIISFFFFGAILLLAAYIYFSRATVTVKISPKEVEHKENIRFVLSANADRNTIQAKRVSISLEGTMTTSATGRKETGTKAKGTVTIYNSESIKQSLAEGTIIISQNNLSFTLDKDVTVASATGDIFTGIKSGTAQVSVTASQIGSEYNLPSNTKFTVENKSSLAARNETAFSGGAKKQISVVAQADIDKLVQTLPKSLASKARDELKKKLSPDQTLLTVIPNFKPSQKDFSKSVGEEAKEITLKSKVTFEGIYYDNEDLVNFVTRLVKKKYGENLTVSKANMQNILRKIISEDDSVIAELTIKAKLFPKIDTEKLKKELAGKSFDQAETILRRFPQVESVTIELFPPLPVHLLPRIEKNISISLQSENNEE